MAGLLELEAGEVQETRHRESSPRWNEMTKRIRKKIDVCVQQSSHESRLVSVANHVGVRRSAACIYPGYNQPQRRRRRRRFLNTPSSRTHLGGFNKQTFTSICPSDATACVSIIPCDDRGYMPLVAEFEALFGGVGFSEYANIHFHLKE